MIPSEAEFRAIISHIRGQKYFAERDKTGDFLEFMGRPVSGKLKWRRSSCATSIAKQGK